MHAQDGDENAGGCGTTPEDKQRRHDVPEHTVKADEDVKATQQTQRQQAVAEHTGDARRVDPSFGHEVQQEID